MSEDEYRRLRLTLAGGTYRMVGVRQTNSADGARARTVYQWYPYDEVPLADLADLADQADSTGPALPFG
jgi:hypothetical protein